MAMNRGLYMLCNILEDFRFHIPNWLCLPFINRIGLLQNVSYFLFKLLLQRQSDFQFSNLLHDFL